MNKFLAFLTLSILIASCKKQEIKDPPIGNNPVFKAFGSIGNSNLQIVAGDNDYKMETGFYYLNGIENYFGSLNNTENQLKIVFKDGFLNQTLIQAIHSGVTICSYPNYNEITLSKSDMPNGYLIESIDWYVDGEYSGLNELTLNESGLFNVCANVVFTDGSNASVCNEMLLGYQSGSHFQLRHFLSGDGDLKLWIDENDEDIDHIDWYLDDQWVSSDAELDIEIDQNAHTMKAEILFENGTKRTRSIWIDGSLQGKYIDDFASIESNWQGPNEDYTAQIQLKWNNKNYVSFHNELTEDYFTVESITPYGLNDAGKPVVKIHGIIDCEMQDLETGELLPFHCETDFAIQIEQ